ncbi:sugar-binding transcriptional regulator [Bradyrhizobium sp. ISRA463]|uniref:sugar-binding transcriptional regulator n=1 Tax=Bradyrhizobium sp. ISRA463 TaxID=2866199 RepID=UPI002479A9F3|nr:sugar-binding transcriptional regulator [Bradyrhizobium sp. ISRA463]WGS18131.1 sugar-binding transcriptional regulator [Bradyrhizobium sp. ISRA463]
MATSPDRLPMIDGEASLATRAAWLYFAAGLTQSEVADRLNIQSTKAHRLIARASREGMIRVFVEGPVAECVALENALAERYGLAFCRVAPDLGEGDLPLKALALEGASFLRQTLERGEHNIIGVGHGRTLAAVVEQLPQTPARDVQFVSLLGGLTRKFAANPFDVIHRLAERTGAEAYLLPVPVFANSVADRAVLMQQYGIAEVFALARRASLLFVGIGQIHSDGFLVSSGMIKPDEVVELKRVGACADLLGRFFNADGQVLDIDLSARATSMEAADLRTHRIVAIGGGLAKVAALRAMLRSGFLHGLIIDEATAQALATEKPEATSGKTRNKGRKGK